MCYTISNPVAIYEGGRRLAPIIHYSAPGCGPDLQAAERWTCDAQAFRGGRAPLDGCAFRVEAGATHACPANGFDTLGALWYNSLTSGCSAARQRASFGTMRSQVQILSPRPAIHCETEGALCGSFIAPAGHSQAASDKRRGNPRGLPLLLCIPLYSRVRLLRVALGGVGGLFHGA